MDKGVCNRTDYYYISSKAGYDPCKTIFLCIPQYAATTLELAEEFVTYTGWKRLVEEDGAVLIVPIIQGGWTAEPTSLLLEIYHSMKNKFYTRSGKSIWGRSGKLWCWETMLYLVGYEDGAIYGGNVLVDYPNMFAGVSLINGVPNDYSKGNMLSNHWMVENVSEDYSVKNNEIPVYLWLFLKNEELADKATSYFMDSCSEENDVGEVKVFVGEYSSENSEVSKFIFENCFNKIIRWKNGPDGQLATIGSKKEFYANKDFIKYSVVVENRNYDYFVYIPDVELVEAMPIVFTLHGRGEPAWLFTSKNGWDVLAKETKEFILVSLDSPENIWFILRDNKVFEEVIHQMAEKYRIDTTRIYLTGFSNGAIMAREMACFRPNLFAGIAPSNAPSLDSRSMELSEIPSNYSMAIEVAEKMEVFKGLGWDMPCIFFYGDNDFVAREEENPMLQLMVQANDCEKEYRGIWTGNNYFTKENGYREGERFKIKGYCRDNDEVRVIVVVMKNMPHGSIVDETRFTWEFLKRFYRPDGSKKVLEKKGACDKKVN